MRVRFFGLNLFRLSCGEGAPHGILLFVDRTEPQRLQQIIFQKDFGGQGGIFSKNTPLQVQGSALLAEGKRQSVESVVKFLTNNLDFEEEHTALDDCGWETEILVECVKRGCDITQPMKKGGNIPSGKVFTKTMVLPNGETIEIEYTKEYERNGVVKYKA